MKGIRLVVHQNSANYRKEETIDNKMTYPLPPYSTVIGAIHNACGFCEYKEMRISIQGNFASMHREPYTDYCFLNSTFDDRGILVKMKNENMLSKAFVKVAEAKKQGSSFKKQDQVLIHNNDLFEEYLSLKNKYDELQEYKKNTILSQISELESKKKSILSEQNNLEKNCDEYKRLKLEEKEINKAIKAIKENYKEKEDREYNIPISRYRSLTTSLKYYEILDDVKLIIHIHASDDVLSSIYENVYNIKSIGRSEDFVDIISCDRIDLIDYEGDEIESDYSAYLNISSVRNSMILTKVKGQNKEITGTKYALNYNYEIDAQKKQRKFNKVEVIYTSKYFIEDTTEDDNLFVDKINDNEYYLVSFPDDHT